MIKCWTPSTIACLSGAILSYFIAYESFKAGHSALSMFIVGIIFTFLCGAIERSKYEVD